MRIQSATHEARIRAAIKTLRLASAAIADAYMNLISAGLPDEAEAIRKAEDEIGDICGDLEITLGRIKEGESIESM